MIISVFESSGISGAPQVTISVRFQVRRAALKGYLLRLLPVLVEPYPSTVMLAKPAADAAAALPLPGASG
jgi:hypothetical protein